MRAKNEFYITTGTVQCCVVRKNLFFMHHFGRTQYDRNKPILTDSLRAQAQPIVDQLNSGAMDIEEAKKQLDKIWI